MCSGMPKVVRKKESLIVDLPAVMRRTLAHHALKEHRITKGFNKYLLKVIYETVATIRPHALDEEDRLRTGGNESLVRGQENMLKFYANLFEARGVITKVTLEATECGAMNKWFLRTDVQQDENTGWFHI